MDIVMAKPVRTLAALLIAAAVAACTADVKPTGQPSFYQDLASAGATLDAATAASMISGYRANNGLESVELDPELMRIADAQARAMVARDKLDRNTGGAFAARLKGSGYDAKRAAENVSAGYHTLAEAFSGWR